VGDARLRVVTVDRRFKLVSAGQNSAFSVVAAAPAPIPTRIVSRKAHGDAGAFEIGLPCSGSAGVESRSGGPNGNHTVVFVFPSAVSVGSAIVSPAAGGTGSLAGAPSVSADGTKVTVQLTNVSNAQTLTVALTTVNGASDLPVAMAILLGDTSGDGTVNSGDSQQTRSRSGQTLDASTFRSDVAVDGFINSGDSFLVRRASGTSVP
jgi:hypothetical protein